MNDAWQALVANFSVFTVIILIWTYSQSWLQGRARPFRRNVFIAMMGFGVIITMTLGAELHEGVSFDLRAAFLAIAGYFGGPIVALVVAVPALAYRIAVGGDGMWAGFSSILLAVLFGVWAHRRRVLRGGPQHRDLAIFAFGVAAVSLLGSSLLAFVVPLDALLKFAVPAAILNCAAVFGGSVLILNAGLVRNERYLLRSAIARAPDFFYVKDRQSRLIAVNQTVAAFHGYDRPEQMKGMTDYDLTTPDRARELTAAEQELMRSEVPVLDLEEKLVASDGSDRWFVTSKVPLLDQEGAIVGLVGVTRDVTERRRVEAALAESRNLLSLAMTEMSDGLAMFDRDGALVFCNERYRSCFPLTGSVRQPGANLRDILGAVVSTGEQKGITQENGETWIETVMDSLRTGGEEEVALFDGRWLHIRTRPASDGSSLVVVSDATTIKSAEASLRELTQQLRTLATTDGLTGLMNRRAFDTAFDTEWLRSVRGGKPLSLLMIDVDKFKAYNDLYGHQGGDECLRQVARTLRELVRRPGDITARYGGEEFSILLPETDEDGAFFIAQSVREAVRDMGVPHAGSNYGIVTISVGLATSQTSPGATTSDELLKRADQALYTAKAAGRDRVTGWRNAATFDAGRVA